MSSEAAVAAAGKAADKAGGETAGEAADKVDGNTAGKAAGKAGSRAAYKAGQAAGKAAGKAGSKAGGKAATKPRIAPKSTAKASDAGYLGPAAVALLSVVLAAALCVGTLLQPRHNRREGGPAPPLQGVLDRRELTEGSFDPEDIIAIAAPVLLSARNLQTVWPVLSERLSARSIGRRKSLKEQPIPDVRIHDSSRRVTTFVPATEKVGQVPHRLAPESEYRFENLTLGELLHRIQAGDGTGRAIQASMPVQNTALEKWTLDLEDALSVNDTREAAELSMPIFSSTTVIWFSQPGTTSNLHYDRSHNFYVLLEGTKTFTLIPPSEWPFVYLYPWLHPSYHQSQVHYPANSSQVQELFPAYAEARNITVTLHAGDMLYVPPYWFHRVEVPDSSDVAISLSVVSPSRDEMFYSDAYWKLRPFSEEWDTKLRVIGVRQVLEMLFERLDLGEDAPSFIRRMLRNSRYSQPGVVDPASRMATPQARECHTHSRITDADTLKIFRGAVENGTASLRQLSSRGVLALSIGNLVEELFRYALGSYNLAAHLEACY